MCPERSRPPGGATAMLNPQRWTGRRGHENRHDQTQEVTHMEPRVNVITLAVDDLDRSLAFYRDGLGLDTPGVIGSEHVGDDDNPAGAVVMFDLGGGLTLALYPRSELAKDARVP